MHKVKRLLLLGAILLGSCSDYYDKYPEGTIRDEVPAGYTTTVIAGITYWHYHDHYYCHRPGYGYIVVPPPHHYPPHHKPPHKPPIKPKPPIHKPPGINPPKPRPPIARPPSVRPPISRPPSVRPPMSRPSMSRPAPRMRR